MSPRLLDFTKLLWCFMVLSSGPAWGPVNSVTVRTPPKIPSTVEAQAKFFQYRHLPTSEDFDQGHRLGSERHFVERHERSRPATGLFSAKVRWGDKKGGYGEHYWDLNHAGHTGDHDDGYGDDSDDGSYHEDPHDTNDYNESNQRSQNYETSEYNPDDINHYEETGRAKRAHSKVKTQPQQNDNISSSEQEEQPKQEPQRVYKEDYKATRDNKDENTSEILKIKPKKRIHEQNEDEVPQTKEKNHIVLIVNQNKKDESDEIPKYTDVLPSKEPKRHVPYEAGAVLRQHLQPEITASQIPRLFLEPSTGHVVDRTTGQTYVLQPIRHNIQHN